MNARATSCTPSTTQRAPVRALRTMALLACAAMLASTCSSGSEGSESASSGDVQASVVGSDQPSPEAPNGSTGDDDTSAGPEPAVPPVDVPLAEAVRRNVDVHGDVGAFAVTVIALDRGFSAQQIVDGPVIGTDGSVGDAVPAGPELDMLVSGPQGLMATRSATRLPEELALRVEFLGSTLVDIHTAGAMAYAEEASRVTADQPVPDPFADDHARLAYAVLKLVMRGYTPQQAIEGIFFHTFMFESAACIRLPELPEGVGASSGTEYCGPVTDGISPSTTAGDESSAESPPDEAVDQDADAAFEPGRFGGSASEAFVGADFGDEGTVDLLRDTIDLTAGESTLDGTIELLVQARDDDVEEGGLSDILDDVVCLYFFYEFDGVPIIAAETGVYEGSGTLSGGFEEGECPGGALPSLTVLSFSVTAQVVGDAMNLSVSVDGETLDLTVMRV